MAGPGLFSQIFPLCPSLMIRLAMGSPSPGALGVVLHRIHPSEFFKHLGHMFGRDADALVNHAHQHAVLGFRAFNLDFCVRGRIFNGVVQEVDRHLLDAVAVDPRLELAVERWADFDFFVFGLGAYGVHGLLQDGVDALEHIMVDQPSGLEP